jgi:hypothetical protein
VRPVLTALALVAAPVAAQVGPQPTLSDGESIEFETNGDFNADGIFDVAYIIRRDDNEARELRVVISDVGETHVGEYPAQVLRLDPDALSGAQLTIKGNVLSLKELSRGTSAVASTHRFRWDPRLEAMRLIGLDATLYSRTFAHDGAEASWNLLTGDLTTVTLRLKGSGENATYQRIDERRSKRLSPALRLEDSPSGDDLLGWPGAK